MMIRTEKYTDHIIFNMMSEAGMSPEPETSQIDEIREALKTASKRLTKKSGKPEFFAQVGQYIIVVWQS